MNLRCLTLTVGREEERVLEDSFVDFLRSGAAPRVGGQQHRVECAPQAPDVAASVLAFA